ncbi:SDR family NAD(P)-dependent oxidoreductase [Streptomyces sp. NPDC047072]|uniref:SDR family NAD(P)-dependent oxidoreductase n=1 Tax=Streptomyces sp. NPDC047072 TaxID=3154809 RepID=UPI0034091F1C
MKIAKGQVAVVTGGASGIGYGLAEAFAARGMRVVVSDVREDSLEESAERLRGTGAEAIGVVADVTDAASVDRLAAATLDAYGRVDLICNNAGVVSPAAPMWEQELITWRRMIDIKVMGVIHGVRSFVPHLIAQGSGHVLNTASSGGLAPLPDRTPYTGTMHAVVGLTETLDAELRHVAPQLGATVLCPGLVDTPLGRNSATLGIAALPPGVDGTSMKGMPNVITAAEVADAAIAAIEADRVHSAPGPGVTDRARARVDGLLADLMAEK